MQHWRFKEQEREEFELLGPPHPGEILREDVLPRLEISRTEFAAELGISKSAVSKLLNERRRVTRKLAVRLARISGTNALYWLVLQAHHDAWSLERAQEEQSRSRGTWRDSESISGRSASRSKLGAELPWLSRMRRRGVAVAQSDADAAVA